LLLDTTFGAGVDQLTALPTVAKALIETSTQFAEVDVEFPQRVCGRAFRVEQTEKKMIGAGIAVPQPGGMLLGTFSRGNDAFTERW
jgi:hypothetical protein